MSFDWWTLLLQIVNILILVWLLHRFLYKPVKAVVEKRRAMAGAELASAKAREAEAETLKANLEAERAALAKERHALLDAARREADEKRKALMDSAGRQADALLADARTKAEKARQADIASLKDELAHTAVAIARTILAQTSNQDLDAVFRARILGKLDALGGEVGASKREAHALRVTTAAPLAAAEENAWREALKSRFADGAEIAFAVDPELVAGAELRLPNAQLRFAWADELKEAGQLIADQRPLEEASTE